MISRDINWRLFALFGSVVIHILVIMDLWQNRVMTAPETAVPPTPTSVRISFSAPEPMAEPAPEPKLKPEPEPKPKPKPESKPEPKPKPKPKLEPKPNPPIKPLDRMREEVSEEKTPQVATQPMEAPALPLAEIPQQLDRAGLKDSYIEQLLRHIERYKHYPMPARKRGIEGLVKVSFVLAENSQITDLRIEGGHRLLNKATRTALQKALPLPRSPQALALPIRLAFNLSYSLSGE
ncbi:energy transducer TonB [Sedimenticola sp.]|uniref:energy transducer TonB n=1 Tax=Sedimenticola sp. TaxID=1940285 RepID=UPI003D1176D3